MFPAHDDCFFRTGVDTESAVNAPHHIDVESQRKFFDLGVGMFAGFDVDALSGTDRGAHVTRDAFQTPIIPDGEYMGAAETFGIWTGLLWIIDGRRVASKQTHEEASQGNRKSTKGRPYRSMLSPGSFADVDDRDVDCVATLYRSHCSTSCDVCS